MNRRSFLESAVLAAVGVVGRPRPARAQVTNARAGATVQTTAGRIRGLRQDGVHAFKGVRYAAAPVGARRFQPPESVRPWTGVRDAFELGPRAPQVDGNVVAEWWALNRGEPIGEDCLCLNVWTPAPDAARRPVMVWLHGGGYASGSAGWIAYDGSELARKHDVVVVGINHRLNVFGFLHLADLGSEQYAQAGNVGMLDLVAALEWVRDNAAAFGGNPANVTIFGQSGGAGKVSTLLGMPAARSLFHKAIAQSGSAVTGVPQDEALASTVEFLRRVDVDADRLERLQTVPMERLLAAMRQRGGAPLRLSPVVDGRTLPAHPFAPAATAISADIPLLIGSTETEVTFNADTDYTELDAAGLRARVKEMLRVDDAAAERVVGLYRTHRPEASHLDLALIIATDVSNFRVGVETQAERKAARGGAPVYMYRFAWYSPVRNGRLRAMHCMDIPFVFDNVDAARVLLGEGADRQVVADAMSRAWVAFARTGNPNHPGLPRWEAFTADQRATMVFNRDSRAVHDPYGEERRAILALRPPRETA